MTKNKFIKFTNKIKKAFEKLAKEKAFQSLRNLIDEEYKNGNITDEDLGIYFYTVYSMKDNSSQIIPICSLSSCKSKNGKYSGTGFGIIPKLTSDMELKIEYIKKKQKLAKGD